MRGSGRGVPTRPSDLPTRLSGLDLSTRVGIATQTVANLVPVVGVVLWGWTAFDLLVLYWLELGFGLLSGLLLSMVKQLTESARQDIGLRETVRDMAEEVVATVVILVFYAVFWGVGALVLDGITQLSMVSNDLSIIESARRVEPALVAVVLARLAWVLSKYANVAGLTEADVELTEENRFFRLWLFLFAMMAGQFVVILLGSPVGMLLAVVALKLVVDVLRRLPGPESDGEGDEDGTGDSTGDAANDAGSDAAGEGTAGPTGGTASEPGP